MDSAPGDGASQPGPRPGVDSRYSVDARDAMGVQIGDGNTQIIYAVPGGMRRAGGDIGALLAGVGEPAFPSFAWAAPMQLPAAVAGFTGRDDELAALRRWLDPARPASAEGASVVGMPGVGKTGLAIEAVHSALRRGWFADGVLFIDLHGYGEEPVGPAQALDTLLRATGMPAERMPPALEERAGLYRSVLAQAPGPVLLIADNASSESQVRPLLPGAGPHHKVLVTSRNTLAGLDARVIELTGLSATSAATLLDVALRTARPQDDRITTDRGVAEHLAGLCAGLPLALQITASILKADPTVDARELADELRVEEQRLDLLSYDEGSETATRSVMAAFTLSYRKLTGASARLFRLLALNPGPDVSTAAAAVLAGMPESQTRKLLSGLARAHLAEPSPGAPGRWRMHDLLLLYARRLCRDHAGDEDQQRARARLLAYYVDMASAADVSLRAHPGTAGPAQFTRQDNALAWLDAEQATLTAAVTLAADAGEDETALNLSLRLAEYFSRRRKPDDRLATAQAGLQAARRLGSPSGEADALNNFGLAMRNLRQPDEAITAHQAAARICRLAGDRDGEGKALTNLSIALQQAGRDDEAITASEDAAVIYRETGNRQGEASTLSNLSLILRAMQQPERAISASEDAIGIFRQLGDRRHEAMAVDNLGLVLRYNRQLTEAIVAHQDAVAIHRETGNRQGEGSALDNLGEALQEAGRYDEAVTMHEEAAAVHHEAGDRHRENEARRHSREAHDRKSGKQHRD